MSAVFCSIRVIGMCYKNNNKVFLMERLVEELVFFSFVCWCQHGVFYFKSSWMSHCCFVSDFARNRSPAHLCRRAQNCWKFCSCHINNTKNYPELFCLWWDGAAGQGIWFSNLFWLLYFIHSVKCISFIVNNVSIRKCIILCVYTYAYWLNVVSKFPSAVI